MKVFFTVIFAALGVIFLCVIIFEGFKALMLRIMNAIRNFLGGKRGQDNSRKSPDSGNPESMMNVITITSGSCQCCGKIWIGTSRDKDCPLKEVEFMGERKVLCQDCLNRLIADFRRSEKSDERRYSTSAMSLRELLANIGAKKDH